jgi:hypothetical protein
MRSRSGFLPLGKLDAETETGRSKPSSSSTVVLELVKRGAPALPQLISHLSDKRPTHETIKHQSIVGAMLFPDEYDYNFRTCKSPPQDVNRNDFKGGRNWHTVTVGDLCFLALGQIVNRRFYPARAQHTMCIMISSPTASEALLKATRKEWSGITLDRHKQSLVRDFVEPDTENRLVGACLRLGYYYPDALEPLVLKQLDAQRYDRQELDTLVHDKLLGAENAKERKAAFDAYVATGGDVARQACRICLFEALQTQEANEQKRLYPPLIGKFDARACLTELYGYPKGVKSKDRPSLLPTDQFVQARFIDALVHFPSPKIDQAVRKILNSTHDDYLAKACRRYLARQVSDEYMR